MMTTAMTNSIDEPSTGNRWLRGWLLLVAAMVFAMILVGGATRLTDSGLSITEWQLITGFVPPFTEAAWLEAFAKYQQIPEYKVINRGMSLAEFKVIYWWEWAHRFLGRIIGFVFLLPLIAFWVTGRVPGWLKSRLVAIFLLGAAQGGMGWFMVMSGLSERTDVSQYRLAAHLALAVVLFAWVLWTYFDLGLRGRRSDPHSGFAFGAGLVAVLIFIQIVLGAFVAGLDAGQGYNTWPLMDGAIIPEGLFAIAPWYLNLFEDAMTVQFDHRVAAYVVVIAALVQALRCRGEGNRPYASSAMAVIVAAIAQTGLGIWTLLEQVPISLGVIHQGFAIVLFAAALWHWHVTRRAVVAT